MYLVCGGVLNIDSHGSLNSPGSPGKYPANRDCFWTLNATPGKRILFSFFSLRFESHLNCSYDYLEVIESSTGTLLFFKKIISDVYLYIKIIYVVD